ncbi:MAG TPA: PEGA domain-containing protein [Kofleriaceae bacterium]|nr:PEGA domain-containing protein [Kofleriaceae bacterium]
MSRNRRRLAAVVGAALVLAAGPALAQKAPGPAAKKPAKPAAGAPAAAPKPGSKPAARKAPAAGKPAAGAKPAPGSKPAARKAPARGSAAGSTTAGRAGAGAAEPGYGTHGFLDRLSKGTDEVERCRPRQGANDQQLIEHAADHYDRGLVLYEQGDYQAAVREFVVAYCDKPHPKMFLNIGQAYERMLDFERAVAYFERFILESDEREPNRKRAAIRVEVLRSLPARILVATVPPGAQVTLSGETGVTAQARANGIDPIEVRKGVYSMRVELAGHEPVVERVVAEIGRPYSYYFRLEPKKGVVRVVATPADSRIFLNDRLAGIGSYLETVPIGRYRLLVESEGRPPSRRTIEVSAGKTTDVSINLADKPRSGRWELILASGLVLGSASGAMADTLFDQESAVTSLIGVGGLGVGFGAAYLGVPTDMPVGYSSYIIGSTLIGAFEGAMITSIFAGDDCFAGTSADENGDGLPDVADCNDEAVGGVALAAGAAGLLFSAVTAPTFNPDGGDAALVNSGAMWGTAAGALFWASFDTDESVLEPMILAGLNLGVVAGAVLARGADVSRGRVALIDLSGLGGTIAGFALGQAFDTNNERLSHFALVGMATGLIAGTWITRNFDEPRVRIQPGVAPTLSGDGATVTLGLHF